MKTRIGSIAFLLALLAGEAPAAFAIQPDPSGLWYDPDESGWGITIEQQASTMFAVLFVYDASGRPAWYVAPAIGGAFDFFPKPPPGAPVEGLLYRTSGPYFGGAFDPHAVTVTQVGTISIGFADASAQELDVDYTIDGVHVTKKTQRQTWGDDYDSFSGVFQGSAVVDEGLTSACAGPTLAPPLGAVTAFNVAPTFQGHGIHMTWSTGIDTGCTIDGTYAQAGRFGSIAGTLSCGAIELPSPATMPITLSSIDLSNASFSAHFQVQQGTCAFDGHLGGVRIR